MSAHKPVLFCLPDDFADRARRTREEIDGGEDLTTDKIAEALGLPIDFINAAVAIYSALQHGQAVMVSPAQDTRHRSQFN